MQMDLMGELPARTSRSWDRAGLEMPAISLTWTSQEREEKGVLSLLRLILISLLLLLLHWLLLLIGPL